MKNRNFIPKQHKMKFNRAIPFKRGFAIAFIVVNNLVDFAVQSTYCQGELVAKQGQALLPSVEVAAINNFATKPKQVADFRLPAQGTTGVHPLLEET